MEVHNSRENTFKVDLSNFPKRPSYEAIHRFVHRTIGLQIHQVKRLQINHALQCAHVKCIDLNTAQDAVKKHDGQHELEVGGNKFRVRLAIDVGCTEVRIHDLSETITNEEISAFLRHYGDVHDIRELLWSQNFDMKSIPSGVRVATMTLQHHIKSFITIRGEPTLVTYKGQPQTCRHCTQLQHSGSTCSDNKKRLKSIAENEGKNASIAQLEATLEHNNKASHKTSISSQSFTSVLKNVPSSTPQSNRINTTTKSHTNCIGNGSKFKQTARQQHQKDQEKRKQQTKRSVKDSTITPANSPPRKKNVNTERSSPAAEPSTLSAESIATSVESTTDDSDMETVYGNEDEPEPNPTDDVMKWVQWMENKVRLCK